MSEIEPFKGYALVELMGHRKRAGMCEDVPMFSTRLLRVDVPDEKDHEKFTTEFYGGSAIYGLHPCSEAVARRLAKERSYDRAIAPYEDQSQLALAYDDGDDADGDRG